MRDDSLSRYIHERAVVLAAWALGDAGGAPLQALLLPSFDPAVRLALVDSVVDVALADADGSSLVVAERVPIPAAERDRILERCAAQASRPWGQSDWAIDGMSGALRLGATTYTGHFGILPGNDPLVVITTDFVRSTLKYTRLAPAIRGLEAVSSSFHGFDPVRLNDGPPWTLRLVQHVTSEALPRLREAIAAIPEEDEVMIDLDESRTIAGAIRGLLLQWAALRPAVRWRVGADEREILLEHGIDPRRIDEVDGD